MKNHVLFIIIFSLFFSGCNSKEKGVKLNTSGIFAPVLFEVAGQNGDGKTLDLGEHVLTDDPRAILVRVHNDTKFPYTELNLSLTADEGNAPAIAFTPNPEGEIAFPGFEGSCKSILQPDETCTIKLLFSPREERRYLETLTLTFKNYVEAETHVAKINVLAGMPASLVFTSDITQYTFGELIGTAKIPVVERADTTVYTEELEIKNAGGLSAKNLSTTLSQSCTSTETNICPSGMENAFSMVNSCPERLEPGDTCKITVSFLPKNQDPPSGVVPEEIKEINYRSTINLNYVKDPYGSTAALNGYFRSVSSNIEARFKVAINTLNFENSIVSGNRDIRSFRINNQGYRDGNLEALIMKDSGGAHIATCTAHETSQYLVCKDSSEVIHTFSSFPFSVKDRNDCLTTSSEAKNYINVGSGCVFDLVFQPSTTFLTDKETDFQNLQLDVQYDSRWRGNETITNRKLFDVSAKSKAAARMVLDKITFNGKTFSQGGESPWTVDFGRLTLQSPLFYKRKSIIVTFRNVGSMEATDLFFRDASGRTINIGGTTVSLGALSPYFYTGVIASESTCTIVAPGETCSITMLFAPIGMDTNAQEDANMFDATGPDGKRFKGFLLTYKSGASFQDTNIEADPDYPPLTVESRIQAQLVRKGMLMELSDDSRNVTGIGNGANVTGDTIITHIYVQNIGTGPVPYFRLMNPPTPTAPYQPNHETKIMATADPASLGADYDCLAIGDEDYTYTVPSNATPDTRLGSFSSLPKEKSCVYTLEMKSPVRDREINPTTCTSTLPTATTLEEGTRFFNRGVESAGGTDLWEFCSIGMQLEWQNIAVQYYDGDTSDPALPPGDAYGNRFALTNYNAHAYQSSPAKLLPHSILPWLGATLYRPEFTYPTLSASKPATYISETWFYGPLQTFFHIYNDPAQTSPFLQGDESRNFVPSLAGFGNRANYDYILYLGSFPQGSGAVNVPLSIRNFGSAVAKLVALNINPDPAFTISSAPASLPKSLPLGTDISPLSVTFDPSVQGEHWMEIDYKYENGRHLNPLVYLSSNVASNLATAGREEVNGKILVIAHVMQTGTFPEMDLKVQDYEVVQNDGAPPTVTVLPEVAAPLSWNTFPATSNLVFDTIKLTAPATSNDVYAKKKLIFENNSSLPMTNLSFLYRNDVAGYATKNLPATFTPVTSETTCTAGMTLSSGSSCAITLMYQPGSGDSSDNFILTALYNAGSGRYQMQNVGISLLPRSPGQIVVVGKVTESINYKISSTSSTTTRSSYPLQFGTATLNVVPKTFSFSSIQLQNTQPTKASMLLSYQRYLTNFSLRGFSPDTPAPTSTIPEATEYRAVGGNDYVVIHKIKYLDGNDRIVIEGSKGCLFGDDENDSSIPAHQKGFNDTTVTPCYLIVTFNANFEFLLKNISVLNGDDMRQTASELWYYSVNRSSTASIWIHIKGTINPDVSVASGSYGDVESYENKTVSFSVPQFDPLNPGVGPVVGIRVLLSTSATGLNNPYSTALTNYFDIRPYDSSNKQFADFITGLANGQFFHFRAVAIRKDSRFVDTIPKRFLNLNPGEYLSAGNNTAPLKVLVPPLGHFYFHNEKLLIDKSLYGGITYDPYLTAASRCNTRPRLLLKSPGNDYYSYRLINLASWDLLLNTPAATSYDNWTQIAHWTGDPTVSIDTKFGAYPGFIPNQSSQMLDSSRAFYIRNSGSPAANVNQAIGGIPGTTNSNYWSLVDGEVGYGSARCMVVLP